MSTWNLGKDDVSEQTQALKDAASSKECENVDLRSQLFKRDNELSELKATLNETLRKLSLEADRALRLESDLIHMSDDLSHHKLASQNAEQALEAVNAKLRASELNERELQSHLEILSSREDAAKDGTSKILKEKKVLEARVRELDAEVRQLSAPTSGIPKKAGRARSSSVSMGNFKSAAMEQDLNDTRASLATKEKDLRNANEKLNRVQTQLMQAQNEQMAMEKKTQRQVKELEASLEEKDYELDSLRAQQASGGHEREEELMKRIEEDEAKLSALEMLVGESHKLESIKDALQRTEKQLKVEISKSEESEKRCAELVREKEETLDELEQARKVLYDKEAEIKVLASRKTELEADIIAVQTPSDDQSFAAGIESGPSSGQSTPARKVAKSQSPNDDGAAAMHIATLLSAIDRLRGERDGLRRDLNFLENENRFAVQALEAKVAMSGPPTEGVKAVQVPQNHDQVRRLNLAATASAIVASHLQLQFEGASTTIDNMEGLLAEATKACKDKDSTSLETQAQLDDALYRLSTAAAERATLLTQLEVKSQDSSDEFERLKLAHDETKEALKEVEAQLSDASKSIEDVESERDSLHLQVTNLQTDLALAQEELTEAENRYSTLQAQQLSSMSSSDVARSLREQIEELEMRVLRRTEQIGIHQHDIKRLETNLRLQEERVGEMTAELETLASQKDAMVEDCADAREARDEAIQKCETLELDVEGLEMRLEQSEMGREQEVTSLVGLVADSVVRSRAASRQLSSRPATDSVADATSSDIRGAIMALAISQVELKKRATSLTRSRGINRDVETRLQILEGELAGKVADSEAMAQQLDDLRKISTTGADAEAQAMAKLRSEHLEQQGALQTRFNATMVELQQVQEKHAELETRHQQTIEELTARVEALSVLENAKESLGVELAQARDEHTAELSRLQDQLKQTQDERQAAVQAHSELNDAHHNTVTELTRTKEDYEGRLSRATLENLEATRKLEENLANGRVAHAEALGNLEDQLKHSTEEVGRLQGQLQEEVAGRNQDRQSHAQDLTAKIEQCRQAESLEAELHNEIASTRTQLDQTRSALQGLESEKSALQIESTDLRAEIQRTVSMNRFLENEVKTYESRSVSLQATLNATKQELSRSEKSGKEAEINLSLQNVRHEQVVAGLRRELAALKANPRLDEVVAELEERNREMDELLKSKCAEIEENDDRILEMFKDKKRLSTKVESLTRKVQALQAKLSSVRESTPTTAERKVSPPSRSVSISSAITPMPREGNTPPVPPVPQADARYTLARSNAANRVVSGPASVSRPRTPERRPPPPTVFKARTPEKRAPAFATPPIAAVDTMPVASGEVSVGKKRARPDEFDDVNVPVQALYAESRHDQENSTPRLRRALQTVHTGFTPKRATNGAPSPGRRHTMGKEGGLSDMTNSPRSVNSAAAKSSKRSWLGKIRGVSSQAGSNRTPSRPGVFERVPGS